MTDIKGYRKLDEYEVNTINEVKKLEITVGDFCQQIQVDENLNLDQRWLAIAKTDLQKAFMSLARAIAKPEDVF